MKSIDLMWAQLLGTGTGLSDSGRCTALAGATCGGGAQQFNAARRGHAKNCALVESSTCAYWGGVPIPPIRNKG